MGEERRERDFERTEQNGTEEKEEYPASENPLSEIQRRERERENTRIHGEGWCESSRQAREESEIRTSLLKRLSFPSVFLFFLLFFPKKKNTIVKEGGKGGWRTTKERPRSQPERHDDQEKMALGRCLSFFHNLTFWGATIKETKTFKKKRDIAMRRWPSSPFAQVFTSSLASSHGHRRWWPWCSAGWHAWWCWSSCGTTRCGRFQRPQCGCA